MQVRIRPPVTVSTSMPSLGALMNTSASAEVLSNINARYGSTFFGERWEASRSAFMSYVVQPLYTSIEQLKAISGRMATSGQIIALDTPEAFEFVPEAMRIPLLCVPRMRELLDAGRIEGWGYLTEDLPMWHASDYAGGNPYQRLIDNGRVEGVEDHMDENGRYIVSYRTNTDDPHLTQEDRDNLRISYQVLEQILDESSRDPTSYANLRG